MVTLLFTNTEILSYNELLQALLNFYDAPIVSYGAVMSPFLNGVDDNVDLSDDTMVATPNASPGRARRSLRRLNGMEGLPSPSSPTTFVFGDKSFPISDYFSCKEECTSLPAHEKEMKHLDANGDDKNVTPTSPAAQGRHPNSPPKTSLLPTSSREDSVVSCARTGESSQQQGMGDSKQASSQSPQAGDRRTSVETRGEAEVGNSLVCCCNQAGWPNVEWFLLKHIMFEILASDHTKVFLPLGKVDFIS